MTLLSANDKSTLSPPMVDDRLANVTFESYEACAASLIASVPTSFPTLVCSTNPIAASLPSWSERQVRLALEQYACFAQAAVHMLFESRIRISWPHLSMELERNIAEEMGAECGGVPHLELMRSGFEAELGIVVSDVEPLATTRSFIEDIAALFAHEDIAFAAGVLLGFEATAVEEFRLVRKLILNYAESVGVTVDEHSKTGQYITGHVALDVANGHDPELDHCLGMVASIGRDATDNDAPEIARGFAAVCIELERWWWMLTVEGRRAGTRYEVFERLQASLQHSTTEEGGL